MSDAIPPIDLAHEPDFRLGNLAVRPSRREVVRGEERAIVEPRVVQALVALARRRGEVVSRDELIGACWSGRIVGDDAINACMAKVRRIGEAGGDYAIETVPRVGYRLLGASQGAAAAATEVVLAVLPFDNLSDDLIYFSEGVAEEILHALAKRSDLKVIGRASSFQFRAPQKDLARAARELAATHVLDGSVRRSGEQVRVAVQLVECGSQITLWSERFEGVLTDMFGVQDRVAAATAAALSHRFAPAAAKVGVSPLAYDLYLRGGALPAATQRALLRPKVRLLEQATTLAPAFADAWARLGMARASLAPLLMEREARDMRASARSAARRALDLEPRNVEAALAMARAEPLYGAFAAQDAWIRKAMEWAPMELLARRMEALLFASVGRLRLAIERLRECVRLDPLDGGAAANLAAALAFAGEFDEASVAAEVILARWPEFLNSAALVAQTAAWRRDFDRARDVASQNDLGSYQHPVEWFIEVYSATAEHAKGRAIRALRNQFNATGGAGYDLVMFAAHLGEIDEALEIALRASFPPMHGDDARQGEVYYLPVLFAPNMPEARRDPRFVDLCGRLGLVAYWLATDQWPDCVEEVAPYYDFKAECRRVAAAAPEEDWLTPRPRLR